MINKDSEEYINDNPTTLVLRNGKIIKLTYLDSIKDGILFAEFDDEYYTNPPI